MRASLLLVVPSLCSWLLACGGSPPPPAEPAATPAPSASVEPEPVEEAPRVDIAAEREAFLASCTKTLPSAEYCECAFEQFHATFGDVDPRQQEVDAARVDKLRKATREQCSSKLSETVIHDVVLAECTAGDARRKDYCECSWSSKRKQLDAYDFILPSDIEATVQARKQAAKTCKGKIKASVVQESFINACVNAGDAGEAFCKCAWSKVSKGISTEEIAEDLVDVEAVPGLADCKSAAGAKAK